MKERKMVATGNVPGNRSKRLIDEWLYGRKERDRWPCASPLHLVSGTFEHLSFTLVLTMSPLFSRWSSWHLRILTWNGAMTPSQWEMGRWWETRRPFSMCKWHFPPLLALIFSTNFLWLLLPSFIFSHFHFYLSCSVDHFLCFPCTWQAPFLLPSPVALLFLFHFITTWCSSAYKYRCHTTVSIFTL